MADKQARSSRLSARSSLPRAVGVRPHTAARHGRWWGTVTEPGHRATPGMGGYWGARGTGVQVSAPMLSLRTLAHGCSRGMITAKGMADRRQWRQPGPRSSAVSASSTPRSLLLLQPGDVGPACSLPAACLPSQHFCYELAPSGALLLALQIAPGSQGLEPAPGRQAGRQAGRHAAPHHTPAPEVSLPSAPQPLRGRGSAPVQQQAGAGGAETPECPSSTPPCPGTRPLG